MIPEYCLTAIAAILIILAFSKLSLTKANKKVADSEVKSSPNEGPNEGRTWGMWTPEEYRYPSISPCAHFDVQSTKPLPYRPFRWGPNYPINLGISKMESDTWLQIDNHYSKIMAVRAERTKARGKKAERCQPGYLAYAEECLQEMSSFLAARYPGCFTVKRAVYSPDDVQTWGDSIVGREGGAIVAITNHITGDHFDFAQLRMEEGDQWNPMKYAGLLQQDDLACMVEDEQSHYRFQAGSITTAGFWRLEDKIGKTLAEIHESGRVPQFKQKLQFSMERMFTKMKVSAPVTRNNYFMQIDNSLGWSETTNGNEDVFDQATKGPRLAAAEAYSTAFQPPQPTADIASIHFRTERQTLRRMPRTGCILFTIRTYFLPLSAVAQEPGAPGRLASAVRSWPEDVALYKGLPLYKKALLPYLDEMHRQQVKGGVVQVDAAGNVIGRDVRTYPF